MNLPFDKVQYLFGNAHTITSDKVKDCKITFWEDDSKANALSSFSFRGWIFHFQIMSGGGSNHLLMISYSAPAEREAVC